MFFNFIKDTKKLINGTEKKFVFWLIALTLIISALPAVYGWISSPTGYHYTGFTVIAGGDKMVYLSEMAEARLGHLLFHNLYTSEGTKAFIFSPVWLILGLVAKITTLPSMFIFHLSRLILGGIFLYLIYLLICRCFIDIKWRKLAFFAICFGSGLGVFSINNPYTSDNIYNTFGTDLWVSEGNTFLTIYHSALFILSQILILLIFWWLIERLKIAKWPEVVALGLTALFLGVFHPYDLVTIYAVSGVWFLINCLRQKRILWNDFFKMAVIYLISFLAVAYFFWLKKIDPTFAVWSVQNVTVSPRFLNYVIGYGLVFIFFLFGIYKAVKSKNDYWFFLAIWAIVGWFLLFVPIQFQRRLANGLHIPMVIIGVSGFVLVCNYLKKFKPLRKNFSYQIIKSFLLITFGLLLTSSTLYNVGQDLVILASRPHLYYLSDQEMQGLKWISDNLVKDKVILTSSRMGMVVPAMTANRVYIGHGHQTGDWIRKLIEVNYWFFRKNNGDQLKYQWLKDQNINYVYMGEEEKVLGDYQPQEKDYLIPIYHNSEVTIYQVK